MHESKARNSDLVTSVRISPSTLRALKQFKLAYEEPNFDAVLRRWIALHRTDVLRALDIVPPTPDGGGLSP
mgnify:FL=1